MEDVKSGGRERPVKKDWLRLALPFVATAALALVAWRAGYFSLDDPERLGQAARKARGVPWVGGAFLATFTALAALAVPITPLAYIAGAVFGFARGSLLAWGGAMLGAAAGYYLARGAMAGPARRLLGRRGGGLTRLSRMGPWRSFLALLRLQLLPGLPFGPIIYAAGIARVPLLGFLAATALGVLPGMLGAVYVGDRIMAGVRGDDGRPLVMAAVVAVGVMALSFLPLLVGKVRKRA